MPDLRAAAQSIGSTTVGTAAFERYQLPRGAQELWLYLDDPAAGMFNYTEAAGAPLTPQAWVKVWEKPPQGQLEPVFNVYVKAGGATKTIWHRLR